MVMICLMIADIPNEIVSVITDIVMWIALALTVISLVDYLWKNKGILAGQK